VVAMMFDDDEGDDEATCVGSSMMEGRGKMAWWLLGLI
jgi:hypothetical protein